MLCRYYEEIKKPMDFGTMTSKLNEGKYTTMEDFAKDVELIFNNCRTFNPPTTYPTDCADIVERAFKREWTRATEKKLSYGEKRSLQALLKQLVADPMYVSFFEDSSMIALNSLVDRGFSGILSIRLR